METVTIPAYAAETLGESITLTCPEDWHDRVRALAPKCQYGPNYSRSILTQLRDMSDCCVRGYSALAYDYLLAAETVDKRGW
jgi:hypothetical protein